jgi:hypothetical protein
MKLKNLLLLMAVFISISAYAQKLSPSKVPANVKNAFKVKFSGATSVKWEMDDENYEAEFKLKNVMQSASFDKEGGWLDTESKIKSSDLPKEVKQAIKKEVAGFKITEASKIESAAHGSCYEVQVVKGDEVIDVLVSEKGDILDKSPGKKEVTAKKK